MLSPTSRRTRRRGATASLAAAALCLGVVVAAPIAAQAEDAEIVDGLVHHFTLDEISGTVVANTGVPRSSRSGSTRFSHASRGVSSGRLRSSSRSAHRLT